jgi:hypothetical protein
MLNAFMTSKRVHGLRRSARRGIGLVTAAAAWLFPAPSHAQIQWLSEMDPISVSQQYVAVPGLNKSIQGRPVEIQGVKYEHGIGAHANSRIVYDLEGRYERFEATVGVDAEMDSFGKSSVVFRVLVDGVETFNSGVMKNDTPPKTISVPVTGAGELELLAEDAGDGINGDHADWANARLTGHSAAPQPLTLPTGTFVVSAGALKLRLTAEGEIVGVTLGRTPERPVHGKTRLGGCRLEGQPVARQSRDGRLEVRRTLVNRQGRKCVVTDKFSPEKDRVRWEVELRSTNAPWSAPILTEIEWPQPESAKIWAAWQDPIDPQPTAASEVMAWNDPLVPQPFSTRVWNYGRSQKGDFAEVTGGELMTLPVVSVLLPSDDLGLSLVESPEDTIIDMQLSVTWRGSLAFRRHDLRLGGGKPVRLTLDLIAHAADWRAPLGWMAREYSDYFDPPNSKVETMAGCGAYTGEEKPVDVERLRRMALKTVWKLSDDYAYMGMFLPPVATADESWERTSDAGDPPGYKPQTTNARRMNDFARWLKGNGLYLLSYFNTTEFGRDMRDLNVSPEWAQKQDLWKNPSAYLKKHAPRARVQPFQGAWQGGWLVDPGDPDYRDHLLDQARRHLRLLPDAAGICIDRTDYLRECNTNADDGVTWHNDAPARSLTVSWKLLMDRLGPILHREHKVIFCNFMHPRLDLARHIDALYDEFGNHPTVLNGASVLCVRKPLIVWTVNNDPLSDAFFQRHLHLGAFPTAPYPLNNHCIQPSEERDQWFKDYGALLELLQGRKWVLEPHVFAPSADTAKLNLFKTPAGYVIPITFAGDERHVTVTVRQIKGMTERSRVEVFHPGFTAPLILHPAVADGFVTLDVPVKRGCAMVRIR